MQRELCVVKWLGTSATGKWEVEEWWTARLPGESQQQQQQQQQQEGARGRAAGGNDVGSAACSSIQGGGDVAIKTSWPFLLSLAPHEAASLLPTCSYPLCTELQGEPDVDLGTGLTGAAGRSMYCTMACRLVRKQLQQQHRRQAEQRRRQHKVFASKGGGNLAAGTELILAMMDCVGVRPVMRGL